MPLPYRIEPYYGHWPIGKNSDNTFSLQIGRTAATITLVLSDATRATKKSHSWASRASRETRCSEYDLHGRMSRVTAAGFQARLQSDPDFDNNRFPAIQDIRMG
jgi:hypothetical protein